MNEEVWGKCTTAMEPEPSMIYKGSGKAPCRDACPAGIDIPKYLRLIKQGKFTDALAVIAEKTPFPSVLAHVCLRPCETKCRQTEIDEPVAINALKRFVADWQSLSIIREREEALIKPTGKRVAVVGSGPAGLTAAYYLAKPCGHSVTVFEELPRPGGMMRFGIPDYRLPKDIVDAEIEEIRRVGVDIRMNTKIESLNELLKMGYDAVLLAVGAHLGQKLPIEGAELDKILIGTSFLKDLAMGKKVKIGEKVVVLGGGNVAFDCGRVALRLGAKSVCITCLEPRDNMLAIPDEIQQGEEEGIIIHPSRTFTKIVSTDGHITGIECLDVRSFEFDSEGRVHVDCIIGSEHVLPADTVIFAIGQIPDLKLVAGANDIGITKRCTLKVDETTLSTSKEGVFAAGDAVTGSASVVGAIGTGRQAAISIDRYLGGSGDIEVKVTRPIYPEVGEKLDEYHFKKKRAPLPLLPTEKRLSGFTEVELGIDEVAAMEEAKRCLMCNQQLRIKIDPSKCVQCSYCQLRCSFRYTNTFNPGQARIVIHPRPIGQISYLEDCIGGCSLCIDSCIFGALEYSDGGK